MSDESGIVVRAIDELLRGANALAQNAWSSSSSSSSLAAKDSLNENFAESGVTVRLSCNYVEIYNDDVTCLLTGEKCDVRRSARDGAPSLTNAAECPITDLGEALRLLRAGQVRKRFAATAMNARSSRAHTVLVLHVRLARGDAVVKSTLHLVDLAGSERLKKSKAEGSRKVEAVGINESLMVLGKVIAALVESRHHVRH
jgi:kinesin family protein C2/C3